MKRAPHVELRVAPQRTPYRLDFGLAELVRPVALRRVSHSRSDFPYARPSRLGGAAAAGRRRRFHFTNYGSGRRWSSGGRGDRRCRTMLMSASPGRGGAKVRSAASAARYGVIDRNSPATSMASGPRSYCSFRAASRPENSFGCQGSRDGAWGRGILTHHDHYRSTSRRTAGDSGFLLLSHSDDRPD